jgi:hypothetical protein
MPTIGFGFAGCAVNRAKIMSTEAAFEAKANRSVCSCHPDDNPTVPCPHKHAIKHCRAVDLARRLRHAITTAMNDDMSEPGTEKRKRAMDRFEAMSAAAAFLDDSY